MATSPILVVMAAGLGSRYGGLKQIDPIGPTGEIIIDYSLHDAIEAGFGRVVFVIKRELEEIFRERIGRQVEGRIDTRYAFQDLTDLPEGFTVPEGRTKPWGTGHAVLAARAHIDAPFAVINGDDFYGRDAFRAIADFLRGATGGEGLSPFAMVGYPVENTLTEHGHVARGVCRVDAQGRLLDIVERTRIERREGGIAFTEDGQTWQPLAEGTPVSMNMWGFTPALMRALEARFPAFLQGAGDNLKAEFFLPFVVDAMVQEGLATVDVLPVRARWFGVTYQEDKPLVKAAIGRLVEAGTYPSPLWTLA